MNSIKAIITILSITLLTACAPKTNEPTTQPTKPTEPNTSASITCKDPRPQMCTREYRPVCGRRDTGVRCVTTPCPSTEYKTYGNACTACADEKVIDYVVGECEK
jgi:hypothetical protein